MSTITATDIKNKIRKEKDFEIVDVLSRKSFRIGHIPGAVNIEVDEIEEKAPKEIPDKNKEIIVYCEDKESETSDHAAEKLESMGYRNVKELEKGLKGWEENGFSFESA